MSGSVHLARESAAEVMQQIVPLLQAHYAEVGYFDIPLDPNFDQYAQADAKGMLRVYTARVDTDLVGYAIYFLVRGTHFKTTLTAYEDAFYVTPEKRECGLWLQLLIHAERELARDGAQLISHHQKVQYPNFARGLAALGYEHMDNVWGKRCG